MNQIDQRKLGLRLAKGYPKTQSAIENVNSCYEDILKAAVAEGGADALVAQVLQGPPQWAYATLRWVPNLGAHRDSLLKKAAEQPIWAYHTLRYVPDVGAHRNALLKMAARDPGWAHMTALEVPDAGGDRAILRAGGPPVESCYGYDTYFVNQTGKDLRVGYNTAVAGSRSSWTFATVLKGQNVGYGRCLTCVSEVCVTAPPPAEDQYCHSWPPGPIDGCVGWGFRVVLDGNGFASVAEATTDTGAMRAKYPPTGGAIS